MKKYLLFIVIIAVSFTVLPLHAQQEVYWAENLDSVSSEYSEDRHAGKEMLGLPNVSKQGRSSIFAWAVEANSLNKEAVDTAMIQVSFSPKGVIARQLAVFESYNPGAIAQIFIRSDKSGGAWERVYLDTLVIARSCMPDYDPQRDKDIKDKIGTISFFTPGKRKLFMPPAHHRILNVFFPPQKVFGVRIYMNPLSVEGWNQLDAVGISNSPDSIKHPEPLLAHESLLADKKAKTVGTAINTPGSEILPVISPDGKRMYFSKKEFDPEKYIETQNIWYTDLNTEKIYSCNPERSHNFRKEDIWQDSEPVYWKFNTVVPNSIVGFSADGSKMFLSNLYDSIANCDCEEVFKANTSGLSVSTLDSTEWEMYDKNPNRDDTISFKGHFAYSISPDKNLLISARTDTFENINHVYASVYNEKSGSFSKPRRIGKLAEHDFYFKSYIDSLTHNHISIDSFAPDSFRVTGLKWTKPKQMPIENYENTNNYVSYSILWEENLMFLSMQNGNSKGNRDIYISFWDEIDEMWSEPQNLGEPVNTLGDESSPFIDGDGNTLYFSSSGHPGFGGHDVFVSRRQDDSWLKWSEPLNLGEAVNTAGSELNFRINQADRMAYFASDEWGIGCREDNADIYSVRMAKTITLHIKGSTRHVITKETIPDAEINLSALSAPDRFGTRNIRFRSDKRTGEYDITITKMIDANKMSEFALRAAKNKYTQTNEEGDTIDYEQLYLSNPDWTVEIHQDIWMNGPSYRGGGVERKPEDVDIPEDHIDPYDPIIVEGDTIIKYIQRVDTVYIYGNMIIEADGCPVIFHGGKLYNLQRTQGSDVSQFSILDYSYSKYFAYNATTIGMNEKEFSDLADDVEFMLEKYDNMNVYIVASASHVPTRKYCSNFELARKRAEEPEERIMNFLKQKNVDPSRVHFEKRYLVEGPEYQNDPDNTKRYAPNQYVRVWLYSCSDIIDE